MALKDIMLNKTMNNGSQQPSKSTLLMHQVRTVITPKVMKTRDKLGGETSSPTDITDDASESVGDVSITSKDSGKNIDKPPLTEHLRVCQLLTWKHSFLDDARKLNVIFNSRLVFVCLPDHDQCHHHQHHDRQFVYIQLNVFAQLARDCISVKK